MKEQFDKSYLDAVRRKLRKQGLSDEAVELAIDKITGVEKAEVRELPKEPTVKLRFCEFCDSKGVRHKKDCPTLKEKV